MTTPCPNCGAAASLFLTGTDLNQQVSTAEFDYFRCPSCRLVFISPIPADLGSYYGSAYAPYRIPSEAELVARAEGEKYRLDVVQRFATSGKLLEIGPGFGAFAFLAKRAGFEVETIEMDRTCSDYLREAIGVRTITTDRVSTVAEALGPFDAIVMWHVVEHLPDVWETLELLPRWLRPGGHLVIAAPNPSALQFKIFGRYWYHLDAPRHVQFIPWKTLATRLEPLGLEVASVTTRDVASRVFHSVTMWMQSYKNMVRGQLGARAPKAPATTSSVARAARIAVSVAYRAALLPVFKLIEAYQGLGCAYTIVLRKRSN